MAAAIAAAPTVGFIWGDGVTGYSIKYAWRSPATGKGERIVLVVDRRLGVFECMSASSTFMHGNKLTTFGLLLVVGILGGIFAVLTCLLGLIAFYPFLAILAAVIYLSATGQNIADRTIPKPFLA